MKEPLYLSRSLTRAMLAQAKEEYPLEACGLILSDTAGEILEYWPTRNELASPEAFSVHPEDLLEIVTRAEDRGQRVWGVFHSHPFTGAWPSPRDVRQAFDPNAYYLIASLLDWDWPQLRAFRITRGKIAGVPLVAVSSA